MLNKGVPRRKIKTLFKFLRLQRLQILEEKSNQKKKKKKKKRYWVRDIYKQDKTQKENIRFQVSRCNMSWCSSDIGIKISGETSRSSCSQKILQY